MGRAERRRREREQRILDRKGKISIRPDELKKMERETARKIATFDVECLLTCFAYSLRRNHKWGYKRIFRTLNSVDVMFGQILDGTLNVNDLKQQLVDETGIKILYDGGHEHNE